MNLLQLCEKCCPEFMLDKIRAMLLKFNKNVHVKSKKEGIEHLEEEEFEFSPSKAASQEDKQTHLDSCAADDKNE